MEDRRSPPISPLQKKWIELSVQALRTGIVMEWWSNEHTGCKQQDKLTIVRARR